MSVHSAKNTPAQIEPLKIFEDIDEKEMVKIQKCEFLVFRKILNIK